MLRQFKEFTYIHQPKSGSYESKNDVNIRMRLTANLVDWLLMVLYGMVVLLACLLVYYILDSIAWSVTIQQILGFILVSIPLYSLCSYFDYQLSGTLGKHFVQIQVIYKRPTLLASLLRNIPKGVIIASLIYFIVQMINKKINNLGVIALTLSIMLLFIQITMVMKRKDHLHLGDLMASTQVQRIK